MWRVGFLVLPFFISCTDYGAAGAAGDYGIQCYPLVNGFIFKLISFLCKWRVADLTNSQRNAGK